MATVRSRSPATSPVEQGTASPRGGAERPAAGQAAEPTGYSWQHSSVPLTQPMTQRQRRRTTAALCGLLAEFAAVALALAVMSLARLHGSERFTGAVVCLVIAALPAALMGYLLVNPLDRARGARPR